MTVRGDTAYDTVMVLKYTKMGTCTRAFSRMGKDMDMAHYTSQMVLNKLVSGQGNACKDLAL